MNLKIIALSNFYYREVALNWVRHIEKLGIENYEIVCLNILCRRYLQKHGVKTSLYAKRIPFKPTVLWCLDKSGIESLFWRLARWRGDKMYWRTIKGFVLTWKLEVVRKYLRDGYDVLLSDTDALWFKDPIEDLVAGNSCDIVISTVHHNEAMPRQFKEKYGYTLCTGWVAFKNTPGVIRFVDSLLEMSASQNIYSDQNVFNYFLMNQDPGMRSSDLGDIFVTDGVEILALNERLVKRGKLVPGTYVWHPISHKKALAKKRSFGKHWLLSPPPG